MDAFQLPVEHTKLSAKQKNKVCCDNVWMPFQKKGPVDFKSAWKKKCCLFCHCKNIGIVRNIISMKFLHATERFLCVHGLSVLCAD